MYVAAAEHIRLMLRYITHNPSNKNKVHTYAHAWMSKKSKGFPHGNTHARFMFLCTSMHLFQQLLLPLQKRPEKFFSDLILRYMYVAAVVEYSTRHKVRVQKINVADKHTIRGYEPSFTTVTWQYLHAHERKLKARAKERSSFIDFGGRLIRSLQR